MKKSLAVNSIFNVIYKGFTALFPLITTAYIARTLLPEKVGLVSYAQTIVTYFTTMAALGLPNYGVKYISKAGENKEERSKNFFELFSINGVSTTIFLILYYFIVNTASYFQDKQMVLNVMGLMLVLNYFNVDWFYQGIEEYRIISVRSIIVKILSFVLIVLFVKSPSDYIKYALILCIATAGNYVFNIAIINRYISIGRYKLNIKKHLKPVLILLASSVATELYMTLDSVMLEYFHGSANVAYYTNATKIVRTIYTVVIAMVATFYPRIAYHIQNGKNDKANDLINRAFKIVVLLGVPCVIGLAGTANSVVMILFGSEYAPSISVLRVASILILVFSVAYILGHVILISVGKENSILRATIIGAIVNALLNYALIPRLQQDGAILASISAEVVVTSILIISSHKYYHIDFEKKYYGSIVAATALMILDIILIQAFLSATMSVVSFFVITVVVSIVVYFGVLLILKNEFVIDAANTLKHKMTRSK